MKFYNVLMVCGLALSLSLTGCTKNKKAASQQNLTEGQETNVVMNPTGNVPTDPSGIAPSAPGTSAPGTGAPETQPFDPVDPEE